MGGKLFDATQTNTNRQPIIAAFNWPEKIPGFLVSYPAWIVIEIESMTFFSRTFQFAHDQQNKYISKPAEDCVSKSDRDSCFSDRIDDFYFRDLMMWEHYQPMMSSRQNELLDHIVHF